MPRLIFTVSTEQKELWVELAHAERVTLSEWIRLACEGRAAGLRIVDGQPGVVRDSALVDRPLSD